jgi:hypothetical protein
MSPLPHVTPPWLLVASLNPSRHRWRTLIHLFRSLFPWPRKSKGPAK